MLTHVDNLCPIEQVTYKLSMGTFGADQIEFLFNRSFDCITCQE